ncbi:MAG: putative rane protein [Planctomycetota bacterium]|nr:putative rane protein [Planctomycetota bacterium]
MIHLVWSGLGFLVAVITFGCLITTEYLVEAAFHDDRYYQAHGWPKLVGFIVAAAFVWVVGRYVRGRQGKILIDPETGSEVVVGRDHTFFFIPVGYWPPILLILGMIFSFATD